MKWIIKWRKRCDRRRQKRKNSCEKLLNLYNPHWDTKLFGGNDGEYDQYIVESGYLPTHKISSFIIPWDGEIYNNKNVINNTDGMCGSRLSFPNIYEVSSEDGHNQYTWYVCSRLLTVWQLRWRKVKEFTYTNLISILSLITSVAAIFIAVSK